MHSAALAVSLLSATAWGAAAADVLARFMPLPGLLVTAAAAAASTVIAVVLLVGARLLDDRDEKCLMARTIVDLTRPGGASRPAASLRRVR